ncbi:MAG: Tn3 family transposase [Casimicrobium sp.]
MSTYQRRFVGAEQLPRHLSEFDVEQFFRLLPADVIAIRDRFRADRRLGPALQLVFLRAAGRPLDRFAAAPKNLLRHLSAELNLNSTSIASLRSIYARRETLYDHQKWARNHANLDLPDADQSAELQIALAEFAKEAASVDELVNQAMNWLYDRKLLVPADRLLRDWSRNSYASIENAAFAVIKSGVPLAQLNQCRGAMFAQHEDTTVLEWLKTPVGRHGPTTLTEATVKIAYLKSLGAHEWKLDGITIARQRAYAQALAARPPSASKRRKDDTQSLEIVSFLRVTLLELTDSTLYVASRRVSDLVRRAANKTQALRIKSASQYREQLVSIKSVIRDDDMTAQQKLDAIDAMVSEDIAATEASQASMIRQVLVEEPVGVRSLLKALSELQISGHEQDRQLRQLQALRQLHESKTYDLPDGFDTSFVDRRWLPLLADTDRSRAMRAFEACTMLSVRKGLRSGRLWIDHSFSFKDREQMLIPIEQWNRGRAHFAGLLGLPLSADEFLKPLLANIEAGLMSVAEAKELGKLDIDEHGDLHLPALEALPDEPDARRTRDAISSAIGPVQLPDLLLQADADINFSEALLGRKATSVEELIALYGGMIAHGTENDAKGVAAMIPQLQPSQVTAAMRTLEGHGRLRRANDRVVEFQKKIPIAELWGRGDKASADMMALDASRHLYNTRVDPRRRTFAAGIYTHVLDRYGVIYDQPIVLNERQGGAAVEGVERHNHGGDDRVRLSLLAVDTHGYTNATMSIAKLLGFDLCPQLRNLLERKLHLPSGTKPPDSIERVTVVGVSLKAITKNWDEMLRLIASIRTGRLSPSVAVQRLGSAAQGDPLQRATDQLGRLLRTLFLCDYFANKEFRREIHTLLNRGESVHQLQRAIYYGKIAHDRGRRTDEMKAISGSHALLTNIVMAWNTSRMQLVVDRWRKQGQSVDEAWLRRAGPVGFGHINFRGTFSFGVGRYADALVQRPAKRQERLVA